MLKNIAAIALAAAAVLTPKFQIRQTGGEIYSAQNRLFNLGYYNKKVTGMYGTLTETSYKKFQQINGFTENGVVSDEELMHLYSLKAIPRLDSKRNISTGINLSYDTFIQIDAKVTQSFEIKFIAQGDKTATYKVKSSKGHLIGSLDGISTSDLNVHQRYPVIATIQNVMYPASLDISGNAVNLHFRDSLSYLGMADSEHQSNINRLLGLG